jgi:hypothetical protein
VGISELQDGGYGVDFGDRSVEFDTSGEGLIAEEMGEGRGQEASSEVLA